MGIEMNGSMSIYNWEYEYNKMNMGMVVGMDPNMVENRMNMEDGMGTTM